MRTEPVVSHGEPTTSTLRWFKRLQRIPGHHWLIQRAIAFGAPYSATIRPHLLEAEPYRLVIAMKKRRAVTNHMRTVHAAAIANLAELAGSACVQLSIPSTARWIPSGLSVRYLKKAHTDLRAVCEFDPPDWYRKQDIVIPIDIYDLNCERVATANLDMRIGPKPKA